MAASFQSFERMDTGLPKRWTPVVASLAVGLHVYEQMALAAVFSPGWLLFALLPYVAPLAVLSNARGGVPALCGASVALTIDLLAHYLVFVHPTSSTAALALIFVPLGSALVFGPGAMLLAWLVVRRPRGPRQHER